jgi:hypothetical protein
MGRNSTKQGGNPTKRGIKKENIRRKSTFPTLHRFASKCKKIKNLNYSEFSLTPG